MKALNCRSTFLTLLLSSLLGSAAAYAVDPSDDEKQIAQQAFELCVARARSMGANAILGLRYDSSAFNHGDNVETEVICYGTAVVVDKDAAAR